MLSAIMIENEISETKNAMSLHIFCFWGINLIIPSTTLQIAPKQKCILFSKWISILLCWITMLG